jgi:hypothetical protein
MIRQPFQASRIHMHIMNTPDQTGAESLSPLLFQPPLLPPLSPSFLIVCVTVALFVVVTADEAIHVVHIFLLRSR